MNNRSLRNVSTNEIAPNPYNPRLIFDPEDLKDLEYSIKKVGILVPLTVYENKKKQPKEKYIILDGERRWRCAKDLGLSELPVNVIDEPEDITQTILFMFNIHHFRKEWELFPTALKLELIIEKLETDTETTLSQFTGLDRSIIRKCKMLLWYSGKYRSLLMEKNTKITPSFFIELYPIAYRLSYEPEFNNIDNFIDRMIEIYYEKKLIFDVKEFREIRKTMTFLSTRNDFERFIEILRGYLDHPSDNLSEFFAIEELESATNRKQVLKNITYLNEYLEKIEPDILSDPIFVDQLKRMLKAVQNLMEHIE